MKKIKKKRSNVSNELEDPQLEDVGEDRGFEIELDEDTEEIIFVHHYRRRFGDEFSADVEHGLNMEEAAEMIGIVIGYMEIIKAKKLVERSTPEAKEGNPMQGPQNLDGR